MANKTANWTASTPPLGKTITGYNLYSDIDGLLISVGVVLTTPITLSDGVSHNVTHRAVYNDATLGLVGNVVVVDLTAVVNAPTGLTDVGGETNPDTEINLQWVKSTSAAGGVYRVYIGGVLQQSFGDVASGTLTGLTAETVYNNITVRYFVGGVESADSNSINVTTEAAASGTAPIMTLVGYDAPVSNNYNTNGTGVTTQYAISTTAEFLAGARKFEIEIDSETLNKGTLIALTASGTNRAFYNMEKCVNINWSTFLFKVGESVSAFVDPDTPTTALFNAGDKMSLRRDASNNITVYYNETLIHTFVNPLAGDVFVHFSHTVASTQASNPLIS